MDSPPGFEARTPILLHAVIQQKKTGSEPKLRFLLRTCAGLLPVAQTRLMAQTVGLMAAATMFFPTKASLAALHLSFREYTILSTEYLLREFPVLF